MAYSLATSYAGESLLSRFNWFDGNDPSHGFVSYQNRSNAEAMGLYSVDEKTGVVRLGVDSTNTYALNEGRPSIRLESKEAYNHGLFVADFLHMPPSECGLWPAFWTYGPNWPTGGEVDIIEGVNDQHRNILSAHSGPGCTISDKLTSKYGDNLRSNDCDVGTDNVGCGYYSPEDANAAYGDGFNAADGGVYAMEWDDEFIKVWHFSRSQIPKDISEKKPHPKGWGRPHAVFGGSSCDVDTFFRDMKLVININFCGDWGDAVWASQGRCGSYAPTCPEYVANNPQAFSSAYWDVKYIDAYQRNGSEPKTPDESPEPEEPKPQHGDTEHVGDAAHLGCFGSSDGFKSFHKVDESDDMTAKKCVELCRESKYAGVFETQCFCAKSLDANTRASDAKDGNVCDHPCPGDKSEFCGGLASFISSPANVTEVQDLPDTKEPVGSVNSTVIAALAKGVNSTDAPLAKATMRKTRRTLQSRIPNNILLTVYGFVKDEDVSASPPPPPMAPGAQAQYKYANPPKVDGPCGCDGVTPPKPSRVATGVRFNNSPTPSAPKSPVEVAGAARVWSQTKLTVSFVAIVVAMLL